MASYRENASTNDTARPKLLPFQYVASPPPAEVFKVILEHCGVGGTFAPGIRQLAEWSGVSRGLISDCLRQIADKGWILYDGRNITLLRHPDEAPESDRSGDRSHCDESEEVIDQVIDQSEISDRSPDRSLSSSPLLAAVRRVQTRWNGEQPSDRSPDRSALSDSDPPLDPPMVHDYLTATESAVVHESSTTGGSGGAVAIDQAIDRSLGAAQIMAELGANPKVIAKALAVRPDWTVQQVLDRWDYDSRRIAVSDGMLTEGIFFSALMAGHLAPPRRDLRLNPAAYADAPQFQPTTDPIRERAERFMPPMDAQNNRTWMADLQFVISELLVGASDDQVRDALAVRQRRSRGGP